MSIQEFLFFLFVFFKLTVHEHINLQFNQSEFVQHLTDQQERQKQGLDKIKIDTLMKNLRNCKDFKKA